MIKINKTYTTFTKDFHVGSLAFIIELKEHGSEEKPETLAMTASSYSLVIIKTMDDKDVFDQVKPLVALLRELQKLNPLTKVLLYTNGIIKPIGFTGIKNVELIVNVLGKESDIDYSSRINEKVFGWLDKMGAKFIFKVRTDEEFDDVNYVISSILLKKSSVYIDIQTYNFDATLLKTYVKGYNVFVEFSGEWNIEKTD